MIVDYYGAGIQTLERPTTRRNTERDIARKIARSNRNKIGSRPSYDDELEIRRIPSIEKLNREKELEIERKKERIGDIELLLQEVDLEALDRATTDEEAKRILGF